MAKANKYKNPGQPKSFAKPETLWNAAIKYFEWCEDNPITKNDFKGKDADEVLYEMARPFTEDGFCIHANITRQTWENYQGLGAAKEGSDQRKTYEKYFTVSSRIKQIIRTQKFEGAAVGIYNHAIIARDLGLVDKKEHSGEGGGPIVIDFSE